MPTLAEKVQETALASLPDWRVAELLNQPDEDLPEIVELVPRMIGPGTIMNELGATTGAAALDALEALAAQVPHVKWDLGTVRAHCDVEQRPCRRSQQRHRSELHPARQRVALVRERDP